MRFFRKRQPLDPVATATKLAEQLLATKALPDASIDGYLRDLEGVLAALAKRTDLDAAVAADVEAATIVLRGAQADRFVAATVTAMAAALAQQYGEAYPTPATILQSAALHRRAIIKSQSETADHSCPHPKIESGACRVDEAVSRLVLRVRARSPVAASGLLGIAAVALVVLAIVGGSELVRGPAGPAESAHNVPATTSPSVKSPATVLLMRTESGPFDFPSERTVIGHPNVMILTDGSIVARDTRLPVDQPGRYLALQLTALEWEEAESAIAAANLGSAEIDVASARQCFNGETVIFALATESRIFTELAAPCLLTIEGLASPDPAIYSQGLVDLDALLGGLTLEAIERGREWHQEIPTVLVAPAIGG